MTRRKCRLLTILVWLCPLGRVLAHDLYEITSTASIFTNSIEVQVEMEFRTALRLAGVETAQPPSEELFRANQSRLLATAGNFFQVFAGGNLLTLRSTNVTLGVENHVQFRLEFPASRFRPLRFTADGLKPFEGQGPYGTTLTVLDMVNKKVLGQTVLYPASATGEFDSTTNANLAAASPPIRVTPAQVQITNSVTAGVASVAEPEKGRFTFGWFALVGAIIAVAFLIWRIRRVP